MTSLEESVARNFYTAFQQKDAKGMIENYHQDLQFEDPAFGKLSYHETCAMWQMLCAGATDLTIEYAIMKSEDQYIETRWVAEYSFSKTKRFVRNDILAQMKFKDGKIIQHTDIFDLYKWAKQALGLQGWLLGGTALFRKKMHEQTKRQLANYMEKSKQS